MPLGAFKNDGTRIRQLQKKEPASFYLVNAFKYAQQSIGGKRLRDIDEMYIIDLQQTATQPEELASVHLITYLQMLDQENVAAASQQLEKALQVILENPRNLITPRILLEMSFYSAFIKGEALCARAWFNLASAQVKRLQFLIMPQLILRAEAAVLLAEGHGKLAVNQAHAGLAWLEKSYDLGASDMEKEWFDKIIEQAAAIENEDLDESKLIKLYQPKHSLRSLTKSLVITMVLVILIFCGMSVTLVFFIDGGFRYQIQGGYYSIIGDEDAAFATYSTGIEQGEGRNAYNYLNRGEIFAARGLYEQAIADFDEAIAIRPDLYKPYMHRGIIFYQQEIYAPAVEDFSQSLTLNPDSEDMIDLYLYRAASYSYLDMYDLAANDYNYILSITDDQEIQALVKEYLEVIGYDK